ncbi:serine/threonine protein kinase [Nocardia farcinica]|uniref:non-specific serine/threonine protein kinase n=1 Tax=Nocardia farcinica TaxID=37329 RepID=A0A0H5PML9_NOCFR|nr:serine/threonine-protein kinase [Nocardia farcinica]CRY83741.1 Serine/threonine-protein kinase pknF [Nocardia farcinica]SIT20741.1 serine/threonine protein kinase [Nocardia farcinica]
MLERGEVFAGFTVERLLGQGGMGSVYLARHPRLGKLTALKLLNPELFTDRQVRARFDREADLAAQLDHPGIVAVYDRGSENHQLWISMQYVDGVDAASVNPLTLPPERAVQIIEGVADALDYAHGRGVLHRDVKPGNILLARASAGQGERVFLSDFGIARLREDTTHLTQTGMFTATLAYASPEQMTGAPLGNRSDQYSLACALYWLLVGVGPFDAANPADIIHGHLNLAPVPVSVRRPGLNPALDAVLAAGLAKHPDHRYRTCTEFATAARKALTATGAPPLPTPYPPGHPYPGAQAFPAPGGVPVGHAPAAPGGHVVPPGGVPAGPGGAGGFPPGGAPMPVPGAAGPVPPGAGGPDAAPPAPASMPAPAPAPDSPPGAASGTAVSSPADARPAQGDSSIPTDTDVARSETVPHHEVRGGPPREPADVAQPGSAAPASADADGPIRVSLRKDSTPDIGGTEQDSDGVEREEIVSPAQPAASAAPSSDPALGAPASPSAADAADSAGGARSPHEDDPPAGPRDDDHGGERDAARTEVLAEAVRRPRPAGWQAPGAGAPPPPGGFSGPPPYPPPAHPPRPRSAWRWVAPVVLGVVAVLVLAVGAVAVLLLSGEPDTESAADSAQPPGPTGSMSGDPFAQSRRAFPGLLPQGTETEGPGYGDTTCIALRRGQNLRIDDEILAGGPWLVAWECRAGAGSADGVDYTILHYDSSATARDTIEDLPTAVGLTGRKDGVPYTQHAWVDRDSRQSLDYTAKLVVAFPTDATRAPYLLYASHHGASRHPMATLPSADEELGAWWASAPL